MKKMTSANRKFAVASTGAAHWSYEGSAGPQNWSELSDDYAKCGVGQEQSPVNIEDSVDAVLAVFMKAGQTNTSGWALVKCNPADCGICIRNLEKR